MFLLFGRFMFPPGYIYSCGCCLTINFSLEIISAKNRILMTCIACFALSWNPVLTSSSNVWWPKNFGEGYLLLVVVLKLVLKTLQDGGLVTANILLLMSYMQLFFGLGSAETICVLMEFLGLVCRVCWETWPDHAISGIVRRCRSIKSGGFYQGGLGACSNASPAAPAGARLMRKFSLSPETSILGCGATELGGVELF